jgi:hypothetical protein
VNVFAEGMLANCEQVAASSSNSPVLPRPRSAPTKTCGGLRWSITMPAGLPVDAIRTRLAGDQRLTGNRDRQPGTGMPGIHRLCGRYQQAVESPAPTPTAWMPLDTAFRHLCCRACWPRPRPQSLPQLSPTPHPRPADTPSSKRISNPRNIPHLKLPIRCCFRNYTASEVS